MSSREIVLAAPRGFCAGVLRAIKIVELALEKFGKPIYVKHQIVHNPHVVASLQKKGAIFVTAIKDVPPGSYLIFSAHGVPPTDYDIAEKHGLNVLDATCPLVTKVHKEASRFYKKDYRLILIGHHNHVEVKGTVGYAPDKITVVSSPEEVEKLEFPEGTKLSYITQTTLSLDDTAEVIECLRKKFPDIEGPAKEDICYATQNRQNAVKQLCEEVELVIVVGAENSSNTMRLLEVALRLKKSAYRVLGPEDLKPEWFANVNKVGITAGASAPEEIVTAVIEVISKYGEFGIRTLETAEENIVFHVPSKLKQTPDSPAV